MAKQFTPEFGDFVRDAEPRLRQALVATVGPEAARDATIQALLGVWNRWGDFEGADPALRSAYREGCRAVGAMAPPAVSSPRIDHIFYDLPWDERTALFLSSGYGWSDEAIAALLSGSSTEVASLARGGEDSIQRHLGLQRRDQVEPIVVRRARELDETVRPVGLVELAGRLKSERSFGLVPTGRRPSGHWWLAIAAAVAMLVIFLPLLTTGSGSDPEAAEEPEETTTTEIFTTTTTEPAEDDETTTVTYRGEDASETLPDEPGTYPISTELGTWTWTRFDLDEPIAGWDVHHHDGRLYAPRDNNELWTSSDGIAWTQIASPLAGSEEGWIHLVTVGDELWAVASSHWTADAGMYRYRGDVWEPVAVPEIEAPEIPGLAWNGPHLENAAMYEGIVVVPLNYWGSIDWEPIYGTFEVPGWGEEEVPPQPPHADMFNMETVRIVHPDTGATLDELSVEIFEGSPTLVEFRRKETGELIHTVEVPAQGPTAGSESGEDLVGQLIWGGFQYTSLLVDSGSGLVAVEAPWSGGGPADTTVAGSASFGLMAATIRHEPSEVGEERLTLWRSVDGIEWEYAGSPELGGGVDWMSIHDAGDRLILMAVGSSGFREEFSYWTSSDGVAWAQIDIELREGHPELVTQTPFGYLLAARGWTPAGGDRVEVWLSEDGVDWTVVDQSPNTDIYAEGWSGVWMIEDRLFVTRSRVHGDSTLWIGELER
jgi:DNA-directed RNA polymerase specialized sigma24 family protein